MSVAAINFMMFHVHHVIATNNNKKPLASRTIILVTQKVAFSVTKE